MHSLPAERWVRRSWCTGLASDLGVPLRTVCHRCVGHGWLVEVRAADAACRVEDHVRGGLCSLVRIVIAFVLTWLTILAHQLHRGTLGRI